MLLLQELAASLGFCDWRGMQDAFPGGEAINAGRASRGYEQLQLVAVGLIGGGSDSKLSSTALRESDAAAAGTAAGTAS
jgi:phosphopantetheine adenylyltransferase